MEAVLGVKRAQTRSSLSVSSLNTTLLYYAPISREKSYSQMSSDFIMFISQERH